MQDQCEWFSCGGVARDSYERIVKESKVQKSPAQILFLKPLLEDYLFFSVNWASSMCNFRDYIQVE